MLSVTCCLCHWKCVRTCWVTASLRCDKVFDLPDGQTQSTNLCPISFSFLYLILFRLFCLFYFIVMCVYIFLGNGQKMLYCLLHIIPILDLCFWCQLNHRSLNNNHQKQPLRSINLLLFFFSLKKPEISQEIYICFSRICLVY